MKFERATRFQVLVLLLWVAVVVLPACSRQQHYLSPQRQGDFIAIDVARLEPDVPVFFTHAYKDKRINFFVYRSGDEVFSFLDACASCYMHKQGYRYEDGRVVCRYCNTTYPLFKLDKGLGGCYPIRLDGRIENGRYLIPTGLLDLEAERF